MKEGGGNETIYQPYDSDSSRLHRPVPGMSLAREVKQGYRNYPINQENPLFDEELVFLTSYGVAGQAYYSRPNAATGEPLPGPKKPLLVRRTLAEKLEDINRMLVNPTISDYFGGQVELYVEDAFRSPAEQQELYDNTFPALISRNHPDVTPAERLKIRDSLIAQPSYDPSHPSPHATGGAVDIILRYKQPSPDYAPGSQVHMGHIDGDTSERVLPDYFELKYSDWLNDADRIAKANRRAFYAIMTGKAFGVDTQLQVNPTEWWHWSYGDQMWAKLRHQPAALYGMAPEA